jgi:MFS family permease
MGTPTEESTPGTLTREPVGEVVPRLRSRQQFAISAYWFATNLLWGALLIVIVPSQMKRVAPEAPATAISWVMGVGSITALIVPLIIGPLSDRCMSRWGRRRPSMLAGVAVNLVGLAMVWLAGATRDLPLYVIGYLVTNSGNNIATGSYSGIIPDIVPESQHGEASGWMAGMSQLGTILGVFAAGRLMDAGQVGASFVLIAVCLVVFLLITVLGTREQPRDRAPDPMDWRRFLSSLWISPRRYPDFAWVWGTRFLVVMGLYTVQEFMQYYLTDVMGVPEDHKELFAGYVLGLGLICATVTGLIGGVVSDRVGRKRVVYVANTVIALTCFGFLFAPSLTWVYVAAAIFGLGYGAYYSVDWALACDVLPDKQGAAAKDMAVWHIALTLPQSVAIPIAGGLLAAFGKTMAETEIGAVAHYTRAGYTAIFTLAAGFLILGAVFLRNVKGAR